MTSTAAPDPAPAADFRRDALPLRRELVHLARRYVGNPDDAEDLVQETLTKAWIGFGSFEPGTNVRAWLVRIMINTWISTHRRAERRPKESLTDKFTDAQLASVAGHHTAQLSAEALALQRIPDVRLTRAVQSLPTSLQTVVYYAVLCQLPYREIAEVEGIPVGTVMSRAHRARRLLRVALGDVALERSLTRVPPARVAA